MKIGKKFLVTYFVIVILVVSIGGVALFMNNTTTEKLNDIQDNYWVGSKAIMDFRTNIYAIQGHTMCYVNEEAEALEEIEEFEELIEANQQDIIDSGIFEEAILSDIDANLDEFYATIEEVIEAVDGGDDAVIDETVEEMDEMAMEFKDELFVYVEMAQDDMDTQLVDLNGSLETTNTILVSAMAGILILGLVLTVMFARSISNPINKMTNAANEISSGKKDVEFLNIERNDEIGDLGRSFDRMMNSVKLASEVLEGKE